MKRILMVFVILALFLFPGKTEVKADTQEWDKSSVVVEAAGCTPDATFTVLNHGSAMAGTTTWEMYVDGVLTESGTIKLAENESKTFTFAYPGIIKFIVYQRPDHPGNSVPRAFQYCYGVIKPTPTPVIVVSTSTPTSSPTSTNTSTPIPTVRNTETSTAIPTILTMTNTPSPTVNVTVGAPTSTATNQVAPTKETPIIIVDDTPTATATSTLVSTPSPTVTRPPTNDDNTGEWLRLFLPTLFE